MSNYSYVSSKDNKYLKLVSKLQSSAKFRKELNMFVIEGLRICDDAFQNSVVFNYIFVNETFFNKRKDVVERFFENSKLNFIVRDHLFEKISDTKSPQGIVAVSNIPQIPLEVSVNKRYIALDNLQDTSNLGAISRTCEALGVAGIIISDNSCDPYSPKALRASMGTILRMPLFITDDLPSFLSDNNLNGLACVVDSDAMPISSVSFSGGDVIIIGNEANGVSEKVKSVCRKITIPMKGNAESLNAAAAAAIAVYELTK